MRFRLRTLLIVLAIGPLLLWAGWLGWQEHVRRLAIQKALKHDVFAPMGSGILSIPVTDSTPD
jgi:hypothetical protein